MNQRRGSSRSLWSILGVLAVVGLVAGCEQLQQILNKGGGSQGPNDSMSDADWTTLKSQAMAKVKVAAGWSAAQLVPGSVNSTGWEDSSSISPDGNTLYFAYIPADFHSLAAKANMDLSKFNNYKRGPGRGNALDFAFDTFCSRKQGGTFGPPEKCFISVDTDPVQTSESGAMEAAGAVYYNNHPASPTEYENHVWRARMNQKGEKLSFCTTTDENDPDFANGELFFWSEKRSGGMGGGKKHLWSTRQTGENAWTAPVCMPEPVNTPGSDSWQCFLASDDKLYFTSNRDGALAIYASRRLGPTSWASPEKVVWIEGGGAVLGVAEPSLTADHDSLYFCVLFQNPGGAYDLDIAWTHR